MKDYVICNECNEVVFENVIVCPKCYSMLPYETKKLHKGLYKGK